MAALGYTDVVTRIFSKIFSGGPFSAVRPYLGGSDEPVSLDEAPISEPSDAFERAETEADESTAPPLQDLRSESARGGLKTALQAFPQIVHLLVDPENDWGENLSREVGLPLISLTDDSVDGLESELQKPKYAKGFILEGYPHDSLAAEKLDGLLEKTGPEDRRVLSWELSDNAHQEVLDHYMNQDLLWMVPESGDPTCPLQAKDNLMSCLHGLPALQ
jgi:hypothetical protein